MPFTVTDDVTLDYEAVWHGPFEFSFSEDDAVWYNMDIRSGYYVGKQNQEPYDPTIVDDQTLLLPEYQWAFGGDPYHVKLYNRSTGFGETLTKDGDNAVMRAGDYTWDLLPNGDGFVLRVTGTEYTCINQYGGSSGSLQFWTDSRSPTNDGSTFRVKEAGEGLVNSLADLTAKRKTETPATIYDLSGRRLNSIERAGIYIINGKKVVVK